MREGKLVETAMGEVEVGDREPLHVDGKQYEMVPVAVGNPHAVVRHTPDHDEFLRLGPAIENHERFPNRTNVQFARVDGPHDVTAAVWERGAGETLSSGTSATAVASAAVRHGWCESPVTVHLQGGDLLVELDEDYHAKLTGPAEEICTVELSEEFEL
jgi:diaminopimelate epimerase